MKIQIAIILISVLSVGFSYNSYSADLKLGVSKVNNSYQKSTDIFLVAGLNDNKELLFYSSQLNKDLEPDLLFIQTNPTTDLMILRAGYQGLYPAPGKDIFYTESSFYQLTNLKSTGVGCIFNPLQILSLRAVYSPQFFGKEPVISGGVDIGISLLGLSVDYYAYQKYEGEVKVGEFQESVPTYSYSNGVNVSTQLLGLNIIAQGYLDSKMQKYISAQLDYPVSVDFLGIIFTPYCSFTKAVSEQAKQRWNKEYEVEVGVAVEFGI